MEANIIFSDDRGECLKHYGVKGMKWGKRKAKWNPADITSRLNPGVVPAVARAIRGTKENYQGNFRANLATEHFMSKVKGKPLGRSALRTVTDNVSMARRARGKARVETILKAKKRATGVLVKATEGGKF